MKTLALFILLICLTAKANPVLFQWTPATNGLSGCVILEGVTTNAFVSLYVGGFSNGVVQESAFPIGRTYWAVAGNGDAGTNGQMIGISGVIAIDCEAHVIVGSGTNADTNAVIWTSTDLRTWTQAGNGPITFPVASNPCRFWMGSSAGRAIQLSITRSNSVNQTVSGL